MEEKNTLDSLLEMECNEAQKLLEGKKNDKNYPISSPELARLLAHCNECDKCFKKAQEIGLIP